MARRFRGYLPVVVDVETGGFDWNRHALLEIAVVPIDLDENGLFVKVAGEYRVKNVLIGGEPLELDKTYTLASHDYMIKNMGADMDTFGDNKLLQDCIMLDNQVLINYIKDTLGGVVGQEYAAPYGQGRIVAVPEK